MGLFNTNRINGVFNYEKGKLNVIASIRIGATLLWMNVRSCFGGGYWNNDQPWDNDDGWSNG